MNIFTRNMNFVKYNNLEMEWVKYNGVIVYEGWKTLTAEGVPPITLLNCKGVNLLDYKIYGKTEVGTLPSEYQEVEYIESDGSQHIDTGLEGKNGYTFETKVIFTDFTNSYSYLAGFGTSSSNRIYFTRAQKSGLTDGWTFDGDSHNISSVSVATNTEYVYKSIMEISNQKLYRNGVLLDSYAQNTVNSYGTVWLFAANYNNARNGAVACKMYYCQFTYDGALVRDFVPCYRKSDGEIGMYDRVEGKFYVNLGSAPFTKGQNVNPTPTIDNEVSIYGVGDKTKNMINVPKVYTFTSYPKLNSLIDMDKIELGVQYKVVWSKTIKGSTYNPAMNLGGNVGWLNSMGENGGSFTFTYTTLPENIYIYSNGANAARSAGVTSTVEGLMFIRADETNDYEEYGYKIPVKKKSKNILPYPYPTSTINGITFSSDNGKLKINGTATYTFWGNIYTFNLPAGQYTLVENSNIGSTSGHSIQLIESGTALVNATVESSRTSDFNLIKDSSVTLSFRFTSGSTIENEILELMIIKKGDSTNFEINELPTNIYVHSPLYKIDSKTDYIDFENNKEVRNVEELTVTGDESGWEGSNNLFRFKISSSNIVDGSIASTEQLCNYFECTNVTVGGGEIGASVYYSASLGGTYFRARPSSTYTIEGFKDLLRELNSSGKPLKIYYPKSTLEEQTMNLPDILLNKGTNVVDVITGVKPSNMYVKYKGK